MKLIKPVTGIRLGWQLLIIVAMLIVWYLAVGCVQAEQLTLNEQFDMMNEVIEELVQEAEIEPIPRPSKILSCDNPQAEKKYVCFSDEDCLEYWKGYSAVFQMRTAKPGDGFLGLGQAETNPVIHIHLYAAHKKMTTIGRIEGELREHPTGGERWYQKMWTIVCGDEGGPVLSEVYSEGFRKWKEYDEYDPSN